MGIKELVYDPLWALPEGLRDPKLSGKTKIFLFFMFYLFCFKVDKLVYHTCLILFSKKKMLQPKILVRFLPKQHKPDSCKSINNGYLLPLVQ